MKKFIIPAFVLLFSVNHNLMADIYKWTDKDGKVHYSATPPKEPQEEVEDIEDKIKANIGKVQPSTNYNTSKKEPSEKTEKDKKDTKKNSDRYKEDRSTARISFCNNLKNNIHTMENNSGGKILKEGDKQPLSAEQIKEQLKKDKKKLETNCQGI